jgi:asparagine synthase (glutamine-hydrolysing)
MGAISAVLHHERPPEEAVVGRMLASAPHRGADVEVRTVGRSTMGVSNVSGDVDATIAASNGLVAAFAGRLDNREELAERFRASAKDGGVPTPAEVLLAAFRSLGDEAPTVCRGVFGGAISDGSRLWAFRDHMAFGGLYFRQEPHAVYVGTEAKQIVAGSGIPFEPDLETVERYFYADVDDDTPCALRGVSRLPKATILLSDGRLARRRRYWDPLSLVETGGYSDDEIVDRFHHLMRQAVTRSLTGNDCISLSGGVDSPAVAAYAADRHMEMSGKPLGALSMVFPRYPAVDETVYIEKVVERYGIELHTYDPQARPLDDIQEWVRLCDGPVPVHPPAEAAEHYRLARKLGYATMHGGDLAEFVVDRRYSLLPHLVSRGRFSSIPAVVRSQLAGGGSWASVAKQFVNPFIPRSVQVLRERRYRSRPEEGFPGWLDEPHVNEVNARFVLSPWSRWRVEQVAFFTGPAIGTEADEIIQAVSGIRVRRPWIDIDLCEFFLSLRAEVKFPDTRMKTLVKRLLRGVVPDEILDRTDKTYFNERILAIIDYEALRRWLVKPKYRIRGVNYDILADRIDAQDFKIGDHKWAVDLAKTHAFLAQW